MTLLVSYEGWRETDNSGQECSSSRLACIFSWNRIISFTWVHLLQIDPIISVKVFSLSSTAACADRCKDREKKTTWFLLSM
ncbi:hypothetical protein DPEC_G00081050 [Dallia pectoralis]|uniref:Uncharacterized protein n=1 Tax=Dallia pectoralis TaxID=75939 RepID=A0ACC2GYL9_DALPE|nr:hypothetical protein DPEC_G00081050 [Dallia pectoralis]